MVGNVERNFSAEIDLTVKFIQCCLGCKISFARIVRVAVPVIIQTDINIGFFADASDCVIADMECTLVLFHVGSQALVAAIIPFIRVVDLIS